MKVQESVAVSPTLATYGKLMQGAAILYAVIPVIYVYSANVDDFLGRSKSDWLMFSFVISIPGIVGIFAIRTIFGKDFRGQLVNHFVYLAIIIATFFFSFDPSAIPNTDPTWAVALRYFAIVSIGFGIYIALSDDVVYHLVNLAKLSDALNEGNYSYRISDERTLNDSLFKGLSRSLNEATQLIETLLENLNATDEIIHATQQLSAISSDISASSEEVASSSQNMAEVANQQAQNVQEIFDNIATLDKTIKEVIEQIKNNSQVVSQIALQTNILALNAGIEASRAGDYGRGFTVVANNVRKLSEESKNAAENIIQVSQLVSETLQATFGVIRDKIEDISALSEETAASSEEVASVAEEMTSSMEELNSSAVNLAEMADEINRFIDEKNLVSLIKAR